MRLPFQRRRRPEKVPAAEIYSRRDLLSTEDVLIVYPKGKLDLYDFIGIQMPLADFYLCQRASRNIAAGNLQPGRKLLLRESCLLPESANVFPDLLFNKCVHFVNIPALIMVQKS